MATDNNIDKKLTALLYNNKQDNYFSGARIDWIKCLPNEPNAKILEIGCGNGDTGALVKAQKKCAFYAGIELNKLAASKAVFKLDQVLLGDAEKINLPWPKGYFSALLMSEVLEHLINPWELLNKVSHFLRPNALIFASSPNVCHHSIITMLLKGNWTLSDLGTMDKTHLRWFTPNSYKSMFEQAGYKVVAIGPVGKLGKKPRLGNILTFGLIKHSFWRQINLIACK